MFRKSAELELGHGLFVRAGVHGDGDSNKRVANRCVDFRGVASRLFESLCISLR